MLSRYVINVHVEHAKCKHFSVNLGDSVEMLEILQKYEEYDMKSSFSSNILDIL